MSDGIESFDRIPLVYGIRRRPLGYFIAVHLIPLARHELKGIRVVVDSLLRLQDMNLVELESTWGSPLKFRRTGAGVALGERLLDDLRISFSKTVRDSLARDDDGPRWWDRP